MGSLDLGVTEPVPNRPLEPDESLAFTREPDMRQRLAAAQIDAESLPAPDEAAALRYRAEEQGVPFLSTLAAPEVVAEPQPFTPAWTDYAKNKPLADILVDPKKSVLVRDEADRLAKLAGVDKKPLPETKLGQLWESGDLSIERDSIWTKKLLGGGLLSAEDEARLAEIEKRLEFLPRADSLGSQIGYGIVQQGPLMLGMAGAAVEGAIPGAGLGLVAGPGGATFGGGVGAKLGVLAYTADKAVGNVYAELIGYGIPHDVAAPLAIVGGAIIAGLDTLSFGLLTKIPALKMLPKLNLGKLAPENVRAALRAAAKDPRVAKIVASLGKDIGTEGGTEALQELVQVVDAYAASALAGGGHDLPDAEEIAARTFVAATVGAAVGGVVGGAGTVLQEMTAKVGEAEQAKGAVDTIYEATEGLKSSERAPDVVKEYGDAVAKDGPVKFVTLPVAELDKVLESAEHTPALDKWLGEEKTKRRMDMARANGTRVMLSFGDFVAYVRPLDKGGVLKPFLALNDSLSQVEAKDLKKEIEKARREMKDIAARKKFIEGQPETLIIQDVEKQLLAAGKTPEASKAQAQFLAAGVATIARRVGQDPYALYKATNLRIKNAPALATDANGKVLNDKKIDVPPPANEREPVRWTNGVMEFVDGRPVRRHLKWEALERGEIAPESLTDDEALALLEWNDPNGSWGDFRGEDVDPDEAPSRGEILDAVYRQLGRTLPPLAIEGGGEATPPRTGHLSLADKNDTTGVRGQMVRDETRENFEIRLTGKESLATFLHETSHYLLELMRKHAPESPEIAADLAVLEEWAGVENGEWTVPALEKFARGMETYIGEGKAPSAKLAPIFAMFKAWILHVYRLLTNLGAPLTDEVRSVMDRMLATEEEISARRIELGYFPAEVMEREGDMSPEQIAYYRGQYEQGARKVQEALDRAAINALRKEKTAEHKRVVAAVEKQLDSHPVLALRAWLAGSEKRTDGGPELATARRKFDPDLVTHRALGPGVQPKLRQHLDELPGRGSDPDEVAALFGFPSANEMLIRLAQTPSRATLKSQMVKAEMTALYPAYGPDKAWVEKAALEKLHGEDSIANAIEVELITLTRKAGLLPPVAPATVAKQAARANVMEMTREELNPNFHRAEEGKAFTEQMKAWAAKDFQTAAEMSRRRLYHREMWKAVDDAADAMDRAKEYVKRFTSIDVQARLGKSSDALVDGERVGSLVRDAAKHIVEALGFAEPSSASQRLLDSYLTKLEQAGLPVTVDPALRTMPLPAWDKLSFAEALSVKDALKNLSKLASDQKVVRDGEKEVELDTMAGQIENDLREKGLLGRLGFKGEKRPLHRKWLAETTPPEVLAQDIGKTFHAFWYGTAERGQYERSRRFRKRREEIKALGKRHRTKKWHKTMNAKHRFVDGRDYTGAEVFAMLLNFGTQKNRQKLIDGMVRAGRAGWSEENILRFIHEVFPDRGIYEYAQDIFRFLSQPDIWNDAADVYESIAGIRPEKEDALAITLPDGTKIEGGYYPLVYDRAVPTVDTDASDFNALDAMQEANPHNMYAANGFVKDRTGYVAPILLNPTSYAAHLYAVDHYIANARGIVDRHKLLNHPRVKTAIVHALGYDYWDQLRRSNNFIANDGRRMSPEFLQSSSIIDKLIYHNALLVMGGNVLSGVNQIASGIPATIAYLGPKGLPAFSKAALRFMQHPFAMWQEAGELFGEIRDMEFHYDRDTRMTIEREILGQRWDQVRSTVAATTMAPVVMGQKVINVITAFAAYDIAISEGKTTDEAVLAANTAVRRAQSASAPKDFTAVQRSHDGLMRVLTSLASYTFTLWSLVMPRRATKEQIAGATSRIVLMMVTGMMMRAVMDQLFPRLAAEEEERRKGLEEKLADESMALLYAFETAAEIMGYAPIVGRPAQALLTDRPVRFATWVDFITTAIESAKDGDVLTGDFTKREAKAVAETVGLILGVPTRHVLFGPLEFVSEVEKGNVEMSPWPLIQDLMLVRPGQKGE